MLSVFQNTHINRPPLPKDDPQEKLPPAATAATTCAAVCEASKSETNGEQSVVCIMCVLAWFTHKSAAAVSAASNQQ